MMKGLKMFWWLLKMKLSKFYHETKQRLGLEVVEVDEKLSDDQIRQAGLNPKLVKRRKMK